MNGMTTCVSMFDTTVRIFESYFEYLRTFDLTDGRMDKGCANEYKYKTTWKRYSDSHDGIKGDVIKCHENLCNRKPAKVKELTCYSCDYLCTDETTKKCEPENDMCIDIRYKGNLTN